MHEIYQVRPNIYQIQEAKGVYFAIVAGSKQALVLDTGYGIADNRKFVDEFLKVPYIVINSHGHIDHTMGNNQFEEFYIHPADVELYQRSNAFERRKNAYLNLAEENKLDTAKAEEYAAILSPEAKTVEDGTSFDLGGLSVEVVHLPGHTKGALGLLVKEERLLLAGDCFNPDMWMFADNHDTLEVLEGTFTKALALPFDTYLGGHTTVEVPREFLATARENVRRREVDWNSYEKIVGRDTYVIRYGASSITISAEDALAAGKKKAQETGAGINTRLIHGDSDRRKTNPVGALLPPIYQVSAFAHENAESIADVFGGRKLGFNYTRVSNPTVAAFESRMNELEGGLATIAYSSGMAALSAVLLGLLKSDDEFIASSGLYVGTVNLFDGFKQYGIKMVYVYEDTKEAFRAAITEKTRLIFAETICNPRVSVADISSLAELAHEAGIPLVIDNTMASGYLARPGKLGADIIINSTSKYVNGSGDAISGTVTDSGHFDWLGSKLADVLEGTKNAGPMAFIAHMRKNMLINGGACLSPQNAYLNCVGLETLGLRLDKECSNALALARHLALLPGITVNYPGLASSPYYELASRQLNHKYGAIFTIRLGSKERAFEFMNKLNYAYIMSNIGDLRTMVVHPASTMALHSSPEERAAAGVYDDLVRVSVGIEDIEDLIVDFASTIENLEA